MTSVAVMGPIMVAWPSIYHHLLDMQSLGPYFDYS